MTVSPVPVDLAGNDVQEWSQDAKQQAEGRADEGQGRRDQVEDWTHHDPAATCLDEARVDVSIEKTSRPCRVFELTEQQQTGEMEMKAIEDDGRGLTGILPEQSGREREGRDQEQVLTAAQRRSNFSACRTGG
jgi:hypothetical protein